MLVGRLSKLLRQCVVVVDVCGLLDRLPFTFGRVPERWVLLSCLRDRKSGERDNVLLGRGQPAGLSFLRFLPIFFGFVAVLSGFELPLANVGGMGAHQRQDSIRPAA